MWPDESAASRPYTGNDNNSIMVPRVLNKLTPHRNHRHYLDEPAGRITSTKISRTGRRRVQEPEHPGVAALISAHQCKDVWLVDWLVPRLISPRLRQSCIRNSILGISFCGRTVDPQPPSGELFLWDNVTMLFTRSAVEVTTKWDTVLHWGIRILNSNATLIHHHWIKVGEFICSVTQKHCPILGSRRALNNGQMKHFFIMSRGFGTWEPSSLEHN